MFTISGGYNDMYFSSHDSNVKTFKYYIAELNELQPAYVQLSQWNSKIAFWFLSSIKLNIPSP